MERQDVECPICGHINRGVDLDEPEGRVECEQCGSDFAPGGCLERVMQSTYSVLHPVEIVNFTVKSNKEHPIS